MQLITPVQLAHHNDNDLRKLFGEVSRQLARTEAQSVERAKALASLENISRAMRARSP